MKIKVSFKSVLFILTVALMPIGSSIGIRLSSFVLSPYRLTLLMTFTMALFVRKIYLSKQTKTILLFWFTLVVYAGLSYIWVIDKDEWMSCMVYLIIGFMILFSWISNESTYFLIGKIRTTLGLWLPALLALGWYEVLTGKYLFLRNENILHRVSYFQNRVPIAFFTNTNNFCLFISFAYIFLFPVFLNKNKLSKVYYLAVLIMGIPLMLISKSRANILGLVVGFFVWWIIQNKRELSRNRVITTMIVFIAGVIVGVIYFDKIWGNIVSFFLYSGGSSFSQSRSNTGRVNLIKNALYMISESLGFGVGAGNSRAAQYHIYDTNGIVDLHNWWLLIFSEFGVIFGFTYIGIYIKRIIEMIRMIGSIQDINSDEYYAISSFVAVDIFFVIGLLSPSSVLAFEWIWVYWGISLSWVNYYSLNIVTNVSVKYRSGYASPS